MPPGGETGTYRGLKQAVPGSEAEKQFNWQVKATPYEAVNMIKTMLNQSKHAGMCFSDAEEV